MGCVALLIKPSRTYLVEQPLSDACRSIKESGTLGVATVAPDYGPGLGVNELHIPRCGGFRRCYVAGNEDVGGNQVTSGNSSRRVKSLGIRQLDLALDVCTSFPFDYGQFAGTLNLKEISHEYC